jgi:hypothetical protein
MLKRFLFLCIIFVFESSNSFACSCGYEGPFLNVAKRISFVAVVKVTKYLSYKDDIPLSMEVEIIDIYKGKEIRKRVIVWGDNGILCRPFISTFEKGKHYAIALHENDTDYSISACGCYWLTVDFKKRYAKGDIDSKDRTETTIHLSELKSILKKS